MLTEEQINALRATLHWVRPDLTRAEFQVELAWAVQDCKITKGGHIAWRVFDLGHELFLSLAGSQAWRCCYCGILTTIERCPAQATLEHVVPRAAGGLDHPINLVIACLRCNQDRGAEYYKSLTT